MGGSKIEQVFQDCLPFGITDFVHDSRGLPTLWAGPRFSRIYFIIKRLQNSGITL